MANKIQKTINFIPFYSKNYAITIGPLQDYYLILTAFKTSESFFLSLDNDYQTVKINITCRKKELFLLLWTDGD